MTPQQVSLVQSSFAQVKPIADTASRLFYQRLFEIAPELRPMFKRDIEEQGRLVMATLATAISFLRHPKQLAAALEELGRRHANYGVTTNHFAPVFKALLWTLEQGLGKGFTTEVRDAWVELFAYVAPRMQHGIEAGRQQRATTANMKPRNQAVDPRASWWQRLRRFLMRSGVSCPFHRRH